MFVAPLAPGLSTGGNYRLISTSPAINVGNNAAPNISDPDLDGNKRIIQTTVDLGAYEMSRASISDPCMCKNNATTQLNGQFDEVIQVEAGPGQTWTVTAIAGLFSPMSLAPPNAPMPIPVMTTLTETVPGVSGIYRLSGVHVDDIGYTVTVSNGLGTTLTIGNKCAYPNVDITAIGPFTNQAGQVKVTLTATITSATTPANGMFTWSGTDVILPNLFNPSNLTLGSKTINLSYKAENESNVSPDNGVTAALPGCIQPATSTVIIQDAGSISCLGQHNISVSGSCSFDAIADEFLPLGATGIRYIIDGKYLLDGTTLTASGGLKLTSTPTQVNLITQPVMKLLLGKQIKYELIGNGNICWGYLIFEDKIPPVLTCPAQSTVYCWDESTLFGQIALFNGTAPGGGFPSGSATPGFSLSPALGVLVPTVSENCGLTNWKFTDVVTNTVDKCNTLVTRTWLVTDCGGNTATCQQTIIVKQPNWTLTPNRLILPVDIILNCGASTVPICPLDDNGVYQAATAGAHLPVIQVAGYAPNQATPIYKCITLGLPSLCNYYTTYTDNEISACGVDCHGNRKVFRTWQILDWCNAVFVTHIQVIKVIDQTAPTAIAKDTVVIYKIGARWRASGLKCGANTLSWVLRDCCDNERVVDITVTVYDNTAPIAVAKQDIVISLTPGYDAGGQVDAQAKLFVNSVDNGSYDNCSPVRLEIRRPAGPSCGNLGYQGHNSNRTFRSNPGINVSTSVANGTTVPNFGQNMTWTWGCSGCTSATRDAGVSPTTASYAVTSLNVAEGVWYWKNRATGLTTSSAIGKDYTGSYAVTAWGANSTATNYNFLDEDGGNFVKFCCEDLTTAGADVDRDGKLDTMFHQVILRVWDDGNKDGCIGCWVLPTTADPYPRQDNYNDTWANVKVDNKVPPVLTCPPNITVSCEAPITTSPTNWSPATPSVLTFTGVPTAWSACGVPAVEYKDVVNLTLCKTGTVTRTFRIVGNPGVNCTQIITVSSTYNSSVVWNFLGSWLASPGSTSASSKRWNAYTPNKICGVQANGASTDITDPNVYINYGLKVLETTSCDGPTETELRDGRPFYVQGPCDVIGVNTAVERYDFEDGVCRKWVVTYTFMNWCNNYCVRFKQDWIFRDVIAPVIDCAPRPIFQQQANCMTGITLLKSAIDSGGCTVKAPAISAWLKWEVFVDVWADGTWDYAYSSFVASTTANGGFAPQLMVEYLPAQILQEVYLRSTYQLHQME
ncbi:MAG: hypothetical protein IPL55_22130 [Saprospiraceae bacterium]|nr:hypothetical protein [Saprospiraceae bacterium]